MIQYGEPLESFDPDKDIMYKAFDDYFNHPTMTKVKDINEHSMYISKMACLLGNECRYIVCFIEIDDLPIGTKEKLSNMRWLSLQTRSLSERYDLPCHGYQPRRDCSLGAVINRTEVTADASTYSCEVFPLVVTLLHKKGENDYQSRGNIVAALETYSTIITLQ
jgi:hypothetical protein